MPEIRYFNVCSVRLKSINNSYFSNLTYSVYKTNLVPTSSLGSVKQKLSPFKWRSNVVSLRAPKHFKVGRQHYNKSRRTIQLFFTNQNTTWSKLKNNKTGIATFIYAANTQVLTPTQPPLTITKTTTISFQLNVYFLPIQ